MPSGARLAFATSGPLDPHAENDIPAARLIESPTVPSPTPCSGPASLWSAWLVRFWVPLRHLRRHGSWVPLPFFFRACRSSHSLPQRPFLMLLTIVSLPAAVPRRCPSVLLSFRSSASVLTTEIRPPGSCCPFFPLRGPSFLLRSGTFAPYPRSAPEKKEEVPRGTPVVMYLLISVTGAPEGI